MRSPIGIRGSATPGRIENVVDFVVVKALWNHADPKLSTCTLIPNELRLADSAGFNDSDGIRFGTRGSEVQILSPRPFIFNSLRHFPDPQNLPMSSIL